MSVTTDTPFSVLMLDFLADGASRAVALPDDAATSPDRLSHRAGWGPIRAMTACKPSALGRLPGPLSCAEGLGWLCCARPLALVLRYRGSEREPAAIVMDMRLDRCGSAVASEHPRPGQWHLFMRGGDAVAASNPGKQCVSDCLFERHHFTPVIRLPGQQNGSLGEREPLRAVRDWQAAITAPRVHGQLISSAAQGTTPSTTYWEVIRSVSDVASAFIF